MCDTKNFSLEEFEIDKNYVIEASAGTGKTYNIVEIVKKLCDSGISIEKILIVTYTDKAAGELKDRIRKAGIEVENASIGTIHSFCGDLIKEYFISAGKPCGQLLIDEGEVTGFLKRYIREGDIYKDICEYKKAHPNDDVESELLSKFKAVIEKYYLDNKYVEVPEIISFASSEVTDETNLALMFTKTNKIKEIDQIKKALNLLQKSEKERDRKLYEILKDSDNLDFNGSSYQERWSGEKEAFAVIKSAKEFLESTNKNFINHIISLHLNDTYKKWQEEKISLSHQTFNDMIRDVREDVCNNGKLLDKIKNKYSHVIIDEFQDTNRKQWDIFRKAFLCEDHNIIVVGDPKQSIYSFQGADLNVYESAKKDIKDKGGILCNLTTNYRATKDIIKSTNNFFELKENENDENSRLISLSQPFTPSDCGQENFKVWYNGEPVKAFWITKDKVTEDNYAEIACREIADCCTLNENGKTRLTVSDETGNARNVSFRDFAVLARTRTEMEPICKAFEKYGIPYCKYKDNSAFTGRECADWIALIEAVDTPDFTEKNRVKFRKAMITQFFGYALDDVRSPYFDKDSTDEISLFIHWRQLAAERKWEELIGSIIEGTEVQKKLGSVEKMKSLGILMQIGDYCVDILSKSNSLKMLTENLRSQAKKESNDDEEENSNLIAKHTDFDCVQVMTIHASKGLEFPVVISVAGFKNKSNKIKVHSYHENENNVPENGNNVLSFSKGNSEEAEQQAEFQRLFYVAYTRAKYVLILPRYEKDGVGKFIGTAIDKYKEEHTDGYRKLENPENGINEIDLKDTVKNILSRSAGNEESGENEAEQRKESEIFSRKVPSHFSYKHAYSSLSHGHTETETMTDDVFKADNPEENGIPVLSDYDKSGKQISSVWETETEPIELSADFPGGTGLGNAIHEVFELADYRNADSITDEFIADCFKRQKMTCRPGWIDDVRKITDNVLSAKLPVIHGKNGTDEYFSLNGLTFADRRNEVEFNFNKENEQFRNYFNGFVDLIFRKGGRYCVLDWKSDRLNDDFTSYSDGAELKKQVDEHYSIQRVLYCYCLIKWLKAFEPEKTEDDIFSEKFGGIYYVFVRGCNADTGNGIYAHTWDSFADLEKEYKKIVRERVERK